MSQKQDTALHDPFLGYPLAATLLQDSEYYTIEPFSKHNEADSDRYGFFGGTLATPSTIPNRLILRRRTLSSPPDTPPPCPDPKTDPASSLPSISPADVVVLFDLGAPGVSGHPSTAHGGVLASCIDEAMHRAVTTQFPAALDSKKPYTAQLDIRYKRPVSVPGLLVIHATVVGRTGRKFWVRAHAVQESEGGAVVLTTDAMALFLTVPPRL